MTMRWNPYSTTVSSKLLIGLTGLALVLYLVVHVVGNSLVYFGPAFFNGYAERLESNPLILPIEIGLAAIFIIHIYKTIQMWWGNRKARPEPYAMKRWAGGRSRKSVASSTMIYSGLLTVVFLVLHVRTFRFVGGYYPGANGQPEHDLYRLVTEFFRNPAYVIFYEVALVLVGFHLWHGFSSAFESIGAGHQTYTPRVIGFGKVLAVLIALGFLVIPLWAFFGVRP